MVSHEQAVKFLQDIVQIRSENNHETAVALYLQQLLKQHPID